MKKINKEELLKILLIIIVSGIFGYLYEIIFYYFNGNMKTIYLRGANFLPWLDIYAIGGVLIYYLTRKISKSKLKVFLVSGISCGLLELIAGVLIYILRNGHRSWNYNTEILSYGSIGGFICIRSVLVFAISGLFLVYIVLPIINKIINSKYKKYLLIISIIIVSFLFIDELYNLIIIRLFNLPSASDIYKQLGFHYVNSNLK